MRKTGNAAAIPGRAEGLKQVDLGAIHDQLRDRICLRVYPPGTLLRESRLGEEFGISRTPVREVLQKLAMLGLVEIRNGVGTRVRSNTPGEVRDLYQLRLRVAAMIGELSPNPVGDGQIQAVKSLLSRSRDLRRSGRIDAYWRVNHALHAVIAELIGNQALRELWDRLYFQVAATWYGCTEHSFDAVADALRQELGDVLRAMADGDATAVGYIQRNYIAAGLRRLQACKAAAGEGE